LPVWLLHRFTPNTRKALVNYEPRRESPTSLGRTPSRRTGRRSTGRTARHLSRHRRPVGRTRQTRLDRVHRRTGRTTLGTPADVTDTDGTAPLLCVEWWRHKSPQLGSPVTAPSPGTIAGGCYGNLRRKFGGHLRRGPTSPLKVPSAGTRPGDGHGSSGEPVTFLILRVGDGVTNVVVVVVVVDIAVEARRPRRLRVTSRREAGERRPAHRPRG